MLVPADHPDRLLVDQHQGAAFRPPLISLPPGERLRPLGTNDGPRLAALATLGDAASKPLVVRLDGNNVVEGRAILAGAAHPLVTVVDTMDGAATTAAELAHAAAGR